MIKAIAFDFDGVIVDSNTIKRKTFYKIFENRTGADMVLTKIFQENPSLVRFEVVRRVLEHDGVHGEALEREAEEYVLRYNSEVQRGIMSMGLSEGALDTLKKLSKTFLLFINTATPQEAIEETVSNLGITDYFKKIYGATNSKAENLTEILKSESLAPHEVVVVGDGENDVEAAQTVNTKFIGFSNDWNRWHEKHFPLVKTFYELENAIKKI